jgi:hypothetical protein
LHALLVTIQKLEQAKNKTLTTPELALNGVNTKAKSIPSVMTSGFSVQAIFPLVSHSEMLGEK